jgi:hypothetical protein
MSERKCLRAVVDEKYHALHHQLITSKMRLSYLMHLEKAEGMQQGIAAIWKALQEMQDSLIYVCDCDECGAAYKAAKATA